MLHVLARTYGQAPHTWIRGLTELQSFDLDRRAIAIGLENERDAIEAYRSNRQAQSAKPGTPRRYYSLPS